MDIRSRHVFSFVWSHVKKYKMALAVMLLTATVDALTTSLKPYMLKVIIDRADSATSQTLASSLMGPVIFYLAMMLIMTSLYRLYSYFVEIKMIPSLRTNLATSGFASLLRQSHSFFQNHFAGALSNRTNQLTDAVPEITQIFIDRFLTRFLSTGIAVGILWKISAVFGILMAAWAGGFLIFAFFMSKTLSRRASAWSIAGSAIIGKIVDALSNIPSIRLFARFGAEKRRLHGACQEAVTAETSLQWAYFYLWLVYGATYVLCNCLNFYFLIQGIEEGWLTAGDFAAVLGINIAIGNFLWEIGKDFNQFTKNYGRISQSLEVILRTPEILDSPGAGILKNVAGKIEFKNVGFHYKGDDCLFQDLNLVIPAGQKVGLVGYSGSGKTSFVNLILRFFDVTRGEILMDGQNIRQVTQDSLHEAISMVPQDPGLFHRTIYENIMYGKPDATLEEVRNACRKSHAEDFILSMPHQYEAVVGERGIKISGGQRQRIAIARAFLKNAPILIMDEATSQLDSVTEEVIQTCLLELMENKTALIIAHRLSTLMFVDRILVFDKGIITQDGTHADLLKQKGLYKKLWDAQVGGFLPEDPAV